MDKKAVLQLAAEQRRTEVAEYQLNIDNYRLALVLIAQMSDKDKEWLGPFIAQLDELLASSLFEQKKSQIMLDVVLLQLGEL